MARTKKSIPRRAGRAAKRNLGGNVEMQVGPDYRDTYDSMNKDVLGDDDSDSDGDFDFKGKGNLFQRGEEEEQEPQDPPYMLFDFRRGRDDFPENVTIVNAKRAEELLEKATAAAEEAAKLKKSDKDDDDDAGKEKKADAAFNVVGTGVGTGTASGSGGVSWGESKVVDTEDGDDNGIADAVFETLKDGSTALVVKPGFRIRLDLTNLLNGS